MTPPKLNVVQSSSVPALSWDDCRLLVESVVDYAIFMLDVNGCVATWSAGAEKIKGYKATEIIGQHCSAFYTPEDVARGKPEQELELASSLGRVEDEGWRLRKDGSRFWAHIVITALRDDSGTLRGYGKVTRDLTARRVASEQLQRAEQRFHHLVDAVIDYAIFLLDPTGHVSTWNAGAKRVKGYTAEEIIGNHFSIFYTPEDRVAGKPEAILETVRARGRFEDESWRVRKDGTRFWANVIITALRDEQGTVVGFAKVTRDLTDRRRTEEALRRSEERFRLLIENVGDYAIYMLDDEGKVTSWNVGAQRMKGYAAEEIIGRNFDIFFPDEDRAAGKPASEVERARVHGRCEDEGWRLRKDGTRFWANAILTALRDSQGSLVGFAKITRDLTLRREAEEQERRLLKEQTARQVAESAEQLLREGEERYRSLSRRLEVVFESVVDAILVQDATGRIVFANSAAARAWGVESREELLERNAAEIYERAELFDADGKALSYAELPSQRVLAGVPTSSVVLQVRDRRSGQRSWVMLRASAVLGPDGQPELSVSIWHDVTLERYQERQAKCLAEATAALGVSLQLEPMLSAFANVLVPSLGEWCSIYVLEGEQLRNVALVHGDSNKREILRDFERRFPPNPRQARGIWNVLRTGQTEVYSGITDEMLAGVARDPAHLELLRAVGMSAVVLAPIRVRNGVMGVICLVSAESEGAFDPAQVTLIEELARRAGIALENAQLYRAAQESARAAEEASRAKDEFLATVSHELRTPLNAILGWSALLKDRVTDSNVAKPIEVIHRNAQAQVRIIDDILDVSRVITGKFRLDPKPADLVVIARDAIEVVRPSAIAKGIEIEFVALSDLCLLVADPERIQQVVWNLLSNAVKFTDRGGKIQISVRQEGSQFVLSVADTGRGIAPDFLPFVFERFKQADSSITRRVGGLGLGLALVRHIVELHGGRVAASSDGPGKGATFTITLPIRAVIPTEGERSSLPRANEEPAAERTLPEGVRVLIVDDEEDARELIAAVLVDAGAIVETARSAAEGLEAVRRFRPDVLVSDIGMPEEDGFAFMRRVRRLPSAEGGRTPSLALTAFAREEDRAKATACGFTTHVGKPVNPDELASAVANLATLQRPD